MFSLTQKTQTLTRVNTAIQQHNIEQMDVVVIRKIKGAFVDHYAIFLGYDLNNEEPVFIANYPSTSGNKTVQLIPWEDILYYGSQMDLSRVRPFEGTEKERQVALGRACDMIGQKKYSLVFNNCEHFANYVQCGKAYSQQTRITSGSVLAASTVVACTAKNPKVRTLGIFTMMLSGTILLTELSGTQSF